MNVMRNGWKLASSHRSAGADGRHAVIADTAVLAGGNDGDGDARAPLIGITRRAGGAGRRGRNAHVLVLAKVDESHESALDEVRVMDRRP